MSADRALVIVPTYNEGHNIRALVAAVLAADPRLDMLVVDDNSPDGTGAIVEEIGQQEARVHVLRRAGKMGLGTAYLDGSRWALQRP
jgi:dolichol-phosphate mannosyltransferase